MEENDRSIVGFVMLAHAMVHTYELSIPILMTIWLVEFSVTTATLGLVVAVGYALFGLGALPGGIIADRYGCRSVILVCLAGMGLSFLVLSVSQNVWMIAVALCLWGVFASVYHPAGLSLISTGVKERGTGFAYHGMAGNVGIAFGPFLTVILLLFFDWRLVSAVLVVPAAVAVLFALSANFDERAAVETTDGGTDGESAPSGGFLENARALFTMGFSLVFLIVILNGLFYRGTLTFLPDLLSGFLDGILGGAPLLDSSNPVAEEFDAARYLYVGLLVAGIFGQYVGGKLTSKISTEKGLAIVFAVLTGIAVVYIPIGTTGVIPLVVVSALLGFFMFMLQPLYQATIAEYTSPDGRGLSYGFTYVGNFGVGALGAAIVGALLTYYSAGTTFLFLAGFTALAVGIATLFLVLDVEKPGV